MNFVWKTCSLIFLFISWTNSIQSTSLQLIITFNSKLLAKQHESYLQNHLCLISSAELPQYFTWNIRSRPNYIQNIPTEYCIIKFQIINQQLYAPYLEKLKLCLLNDSAIESIHFDQECNRKLMENHNDAQSSQNGSTSSSFLPSTLTEQYNKLGYRGGGIKIAIFDTGLTTNHPYFNSYERYDWTNEELVQDEIGHGTFVAGIVGNTSPKCPGMAPDATLHIFRIFTKNQKSYTSWFLDAFNYAIFLKIDVVNLSIGGPDHNDIPFRKKIDEMAENGIIIVSAMGNTGPIWGTANSPADQNSVIGVGGWHSGTQISSFSSRGMSVWEIPHGIGRFKPDLIAPSVNLISISSTTPYQCYQLSGTSVATPIVTGSIAILLSSLPSRDQDHLPSHTDSTSLYREDITNIAAIKQIFMISSIKLENLQESFDQNSNPTIFEQGSGLLNLDQSMNYLLTTFTPHVSFWPFKISNHPSYCPYLWPFCDHLLYHTSQPLLMNVTILNSLAVTSGIYRIEYLEKTVQFGEMMDGITFSIQKDQFHHHRVILRGNILVVKVDFDEIIWPWSGNLGISVTVNKYVSGFVGNVTGLLTVYVGDIMSHIENSKLFMKYSDWNINQKTSLELDIVVTKSPERKQRILWDVYHSLSYPSPYVPNDTPTDTSTLFDLYGDHPYTNYRDTYLHLRSLGYVIDILRGPFTCFDATMYSLLLITDPEEIFTDEEINKLENDLRLHSLSLLILSDWYDEITLQESHFYDDNTHSEWYPITGGSNIPEINKLLSRFEMQIGLQTFYGSFKIHSSLSSISFSYGNTISKWPQDGYIFTTQSGELYPLHGGYLRGQFNPNQVIIGTYSLQDNEESEESEGNEGRVKGNEINEGGGGRILVYCDSYLIDMKKALMKSQQHDSELILLNSFLSYLIHGITPFYLTDKQQLRGGSSFEDKNLMRSMTTLKQQLNEMNKIIKENEMRFEEFLRYSKYSKEMTLNELEKRCVEIL